MVPEEDLLYPSNVLINNIYKVHESIRCYFWCYNKTSLYCYFRYD